MNAQVFGGMDADGDHSSNLYFLDTRTKQWVTPTVMGEPPAVRAGHAAALLGARWLLAGGGGGETPVTTSLCLNLATLEAGFVRWEAPVRFCFFCLIPLARLFTLVLPRVESGGPV